MMVLSMAHGPDLDRLLPLDAPAGRAEREAAVCVPVTRGPEGSGTLLLRRTMEVPTHKGEYCFPGGGWAAGDRDLVDTAVRELGEEIGLAARHVRPLGLLPAVETLYGVRVQPVVAELDLQTTPMPDGREVDLVLTWPWAVLTAPGVRQLRPLHALKPETRSRGMANRSLPAYVVGPHVIWGLTAHILDMLLLPGPEAPPLPWPARSMPPWNPFTS